jgi:integrase
MAMGRSPRGQILRRETAKGITWALRFQAYGARRYLTLGPERDGWDRERAEEELAAVLADIRRGLWTPPTRGRPAGGRAECPDFHRFASDWLAGRSGEISERGLAYYRWALQYHLLPYFAEWKLAEIDVQAVDEYRRFKVMQSEEVRATSERTDTSVTDRAPRPRPLSAATINKTIEVLGAVLSPAVEYGHIDRNPASGRRRRLRVPARAPVYLDTTEQIEALLEAARRLDAKPTSKIADRLPLIGVLLLGGLRASEACGLRWRDVDLSNARIRVTRSKTQAGLRLVSLVPLLHEQLASHRDAVGKADHERPLFPSASGRARDKDNLRNRVLAPVLAETDEILTMAGHPPLPAGITPHKLRHTFASILLACGEDPASVMAQLGHTDPRFTLRVYTHLMPRGAAERRRLKALIYGSDGSPPTPCLGGAGHRRGVGIQLEAEPQVSRRHP